MEESSKFRLEVRKMKCLYCDLIVLVEQVIDTINHFHLGCPNCGEDMKHMDNITVVQEKE